MHIYTAHLRPHSSAPDRDLRIIREGFAYPAALFPLLWALWHRMWLVAALLVATGLAAGAALQAVSLGAGFSLLICAAVVFLLGLMGNDLRRWTLTRAGWDVAGVVAAPDADAAAHRLMDSRPELFCGSVRTKTAPRTATQGWDAAWPDPFGPRMGSDADNAVWRSAPGTDG